MNLLAKRFRNHSRCRRQLKKILFVEQLEDRRLLATVTVDTSELPLNVPPPVSEQLTVSTEDASAAEPHRVFYEPVSPTDEGIIRLEVPEHWQEATVQLRISGTATRTQDYTIEKEPLSSIVLDITGNELFVTIPTGVTEANLRIVPIWDYEEAENNETVILTINPSPQVFPGSPGYIINASGSGQVTIIDELEGLNLGTSPDTVLEYRTEEEYAAFYVRPDNSTVKMTGTAYLRIDASAYGAATPVTDYALVAEYPTADVGLILTPVGNNIWHTNNFSISGLSLLRIRVVPVNDRILEGDEEIDAELRTPANNSFADMQHGNGFVTIEEMYLDANSQKDELSTCGCGCTTCEDGSAIETKLQSGNVKTTAGGGLVTIVTEDQNGANPVVYVGLGIPSSKVKPTSIDVTVQVIEPDTDTNGQLRGLGRKLVTGNALAAPAFTLVSLSSIVPGDMAWFALQVDVSAFLVSWTRSTGINGASNGITNQIIPIEVLAHPNFPLLKPGGAAVLTEDKFSGWVGRFNHAVKDELQSGIAPSFAPNTDFAIDRIIRNTKMLVPDTTLGDSGGKVVFETGTMLYRADGTTSWFKNNSETPPDSQDTLNGDVITDRFGNTKRFNASGDLIEFKNPAGNTTTFTYSTDGRLTSITDWRGQATNIVYDLSANPKLVTITTVNSAIAADNRIVYLSWSATTGRDGTLKVRYDDPDGTGPRLAREDAHIFTSGGLLTQIQTGEVNNPLHTITLTQNTGTRRLSSILYADGSSSTIDLARLGNSTIPKSFQGGVIDSSSIWAMVRDPGATGINPIRNYAAITELRSGTSEPQRTIFQLDHRGRVRRFWDALQVHRLALDTASMTASTTNTTLQANLDLSYEYTLAPTFRNSLGKITGTDWGEVLVMNSPDPDKIAANGSTVSNGPRIRQIDTMSYTDNNPFHIQQPLQPAENLEWSVPFDILTSYTSESGNKYTQTVDPLTGLVSSRRWLQGSPLDVNADGVISIADSVLIVNFINANGSNQPPPAAPPYLDVNADNVVTSSDSLLILDYLNAPGTGPYSDLPYTSAQVDVLYTTSASGLPAGLVSKESTITGRASGNIIVDYAYINNPSDKARHGRLSTITEAPGASQAVTTLLYDNRGNVSQITDSVGRVTKNSYDFRDRLFSTIYPDSDGAGPLLSVVVRYDYDVFDNLIAMEEINSRMEGANLIVTSLTTSYTYDNANRITNIYTQRPANGGDLPTGNWYVYSNAGVAALTNAKTTATANPINAAMLETYALSTSRISTLQNTTTALQGLVTSYTYFTGGQPNSVTVTETDKVPVTPISRTSVVDLDRLNRPVNLIAPDPVTGLTTTATDVRFNGGFVTSLQYDNLGNVLSTTDGLNNATSMSYDDLNRVTKVARPNPVSGATFDTNFNYQVTRLGWTVRQTDPLGRTIQTDLDALQRPRTVSGAISTLNYRYWSDGQLRSITDEFGGVTDFNYDGRGRLTTRTDPIPATGVARSDLTYQYTLDSLVSSFTDPMSRVTTYSYDAGGRLNLIVEPDPDGAGSVLPPQTSFVMDAFGNIMSKFDAFNQTYKYAYDSWSRPLTMTDPRAAVTTTVYDSFSNVTSVTDALVNVTSYTYNRLDQLVTENKPVGGVAMNRSYSYDGVGNLRSSIDRNGRIIERTYDKLYRQTNETWKTGATVNRTMDYLYDQVDNLIRVDDSLSSATDFDFVYDNRDQMIIEKQQIGMFSASQSVLLKNDYDLTGNRSGLTANLGGTISGSTITGGVNDFKNQYTFDGMDRLTQVTQASVSGGNAVAPKTATMKYNAASQLTDLRRYNLATVNASNLKVHTRNDYDQSGRLKSITHAKTEIAAGQNWVGTSAVPASVGAANMLAAYFIVWDRDNRLANFSSYRDAFKTTYTYNTTDELTAASSAVIAGMTLPFTLPASESYNLDLDGNRRTSGGVSQSANGTQNQLQTDGTYNYSYDNEGNTTRRTVISTGAVTDYAWDHRNRLASVFERPSAAAETTKRTTFVYDAFDRRMGKRLDTNGDAIADQADAWVWDGEHEVMQYRDADGAGATQSHRLLNRFLFGEVVDQILSDEQYAPSTGPLVSSTTASATTGNTLWTLTDHLGSVRDVVDNNGVVRQHLVFDSFGRRTLEVDYNASGTVIASNDPAAIDELFAFTGRDWDSDVGLQYNRARWYDPATGRWLSQDPIGFAAGDVNLYRYVRNGPTNAIDPSGEIPHEKAQWHHLLPIQFEAEFAALGFKINTAEYGWIIDAEYHTLQKGGGNRCLHPEWNNRWSKFFDERKGKVITRSDVLTQLETMRKDFDFLLKNGKQAIHSNQEWQKWLTRMRAAKDAARATGKAVKVAIKATKVTGVIIFVYVAATDSVVCAAEGATRDALWPFLDLAEQAGVSETLDSYDDLIEYQKSLNKVRQQNLDNILDGGPIPATAGGRRVPWNR